MRQITQATERGTDWLVDTNDWENPETLIDYLRAAAAPDQYRVEGTSVWATDDALVAATTALALDVASQQELTDY